MTAPIDEVRVEEIKKTLAGYVVEGRLDKRVLDLLLIGEQFAPVECELLDYKSELENDRLPKAKTVRQIVSFYNTYGGYLIYGVDEAESETHFDPIGIQKDSIDVESLKGLLKEYTGERIGISLQYVQLPRPKKEDMRGDHIAILHIPKRLDKDPLAFGRDGPGDGKGGRPIFLAEDVYYRKSDECLLAKGKAVLSLAGPRDCPYLQKAQSIELLLPKRVQMQHNLPDRAVICSRFIGRRTEIDQLWSWFADEFSHVHVLAGEGGLGKTSIAYQFCEEILTAIEVDVERVVWLSAKSEKFSGIQNQALLMPERHFANYVELLHVLCSELGHPEGDIAGSSEKRLKKMIQEGVQTFPTLIVIDDIDSLEPEEQRKSLEVGFLFNGTKSRLLATTRINQSYSSEIAIQIQGFNSEEYVDYVASLNDRYAYVKLSQAEIDAMHKVTSGSPLFTDSLYRLMRAMSPHTAMNEWRGKMGEEARAAALNREVQQLSQEAKRVLLAAALMLECSYSEISEVTGYPDVTLGDTINELQSIYLLAAPTFTAERRVRIGANTRTYAISNKSNLANDHARIDRRVQELRSQAKLHRLSRDNHLVGAAVHQAMALLKKGDVSDALETVVVAERSIKNNPDLMVLRARCLLKLEPPRADEARQLVRKAYESGARKEILFELWYEAESSAGNFSGAMEAAECALKADGGGKQEWFIRRAAAGWRVAVDQERSRNVERAISDYWGCDEDLSKAYALANSDEQLEIRQQRFSIHDAIWNLIRHADRDSVETPARAVLEVVRMMRCGDVRVSLCLRLCEALGWFNLILEREKAPIGERLRNLVEQKYREAREALMKIVGQRRNDKRMAHLEAQLLGAEQGYESVSRKRGFGSH